jgi:16S rRNA (uracil1498-N3)-methyltransferase
LISFIKQIILKQVCSVPRRFFIPSDQIKHPISVLTGRQLNHAKNVLRLKPGDEVSLLDGAGAEYIGRILTISSKEATVEISKKVKKAPKSSATISIAQAFLKEKKMDRLIRHLTELGIDRVIPFFSHRSVSRPDAKRLALRENRWKKIMIEAVKQCGRRRLMEIGGAVSFEQVLDSGVSADFKFIFWEKAADLLIPGKNCPENSKAGSVFAVIGPEGGFCEKEVKCAIDKGFQPVGMGPRILRAETAALASAAILQFVFGDMG